MFSRIRTTDWVYRRIHNLLSRESSRSLFDDPIPIQIATPRVRYLLCIPEDRYIILAVVHDALSCGPGWCIPCQSALAMMSALHLQSCRRYISYSMDRSTGWLSVLPARWGSLAFFVSSLLLPCRPPFCLYIANMRLSVLDISLICGILAATGLLIGM